MLGFLNFTGVIIKSSLLLLGSPTRQLYGVFLRDSNRPSWSERERELEKVGRERKRLEGDVGNQRDNLCVLRESGTQSELIPFDIDSTR